jgi:hypothetical protein
LKQFEEVINLDDTPIEFMDQSAALWETLSFNQHRTGNKDGYESAAIIQLSGKILITNQKVDIIMTKILLIHSKTLIRPWFQLNLINRKFILIQVMKQVV